MRFRIFLKSVLRVVMLFAMCVLSGAHPSRAQGNFYSLVIDQTRETMLLSNNLFQMNQAVGGGSGSSSGGSRNRKNAGKKAAVARANSKTTFKPVDTDLMPAVFATAAGKAAERFYVPGGGSDQPYFRMHVPDKLEFMQKLFHYQDSMRIRDGGIYVNDVAYAAGEMVLQCLRIDGRASTLSPAKIKALRAQITRYFENNAQFQRLSNEKKQRMYESYAILATFLKFRYDEAQSEGENAVLNEIRDAARKPVELFLGAPMTKIAFTDKGAKRK